MTCFRSGVFAASRTGVRLTGCWETPGARDPMEGFGTVKRWEDFRTKFGVLRKTKNSKPTRRVDLRPPRDQFAFNQGVRHSPPQHFTTTTQATMFAHQGNQMFNLTSFQVEPDHARHLVSIETMG